MERLRATRTKVYRGSEEANDYVQDLIAANSSAANLDPGWAAEARKRGILAVRGLWQKDTGRGKPGYAHAEQSLLHWVKEANSVGDMLGASFKLTKIGTYSREPCGPGEANCRARLQEADVAVDPKLRQVAAEIHNSPQHVEAKKRTLAVAEVTVTVQISGK